MSSADRLTEELRRQAEGLPDQHPISLHDVQSRARGIRRRRYAVSGLAAAAVLAVTVPLGIAAGDRLDRGSQGPVDRPGEDRSVTQDPTPTPTPAPVPPDLPRRVRLTSDVEPTTTAPTVAVLAGGAIHLPDGSTIEVAADYDTLVPLGTGYVVGGYSGDTGERSTALLDASGDVVWTEPSLGAPVVSPSGRLVAFGRSDGTTVTVDENGGRRELTTRRPADYQVAAVVDEAGSCYAGGASCTVYSNSTITLDALSQSTRTTDRAGVPKNAETIDDLPSQVEAVSITGRLALTVSADASGLCSAVAEPDGARLWRSCTWRLGEFSPDGRFVLGTSLEDGAGPRTVAVLDVRTGQVVREFAARGRDDVFVRRAVWDADGSVLATVWDTGRWSVLRLTPDGSLTAVPVEGLEDLEGADDPDATPVVLALAPSSRSD